MAEQNEELETLRRTNSELVAKNTTRKAKIAELEAANAELQAKFSAATASLRAITIEGPLKSMAESISVCPDLWIEQFSKHYKLELVDGNLTIHSAADSMPVQKEGKAVPFEAKALTELLTTGDDATAKAFKAITIVSRASGGNGEHKSTPSTPKPAKVQFGLR